MIEPGHQPGWLSPPTAASVERPLWMLVGPGSGAVLAACQFGVLAGLHNAVQRDLGFSSLILVIVVVTNLVAAGLGIAIGYLLGRRAPTSVVVPGLVLMLAGAVVTGISGAPAVVIAAGFVAGLGGGAVLGTAAGLTGQVGERRGPVRLGLGLAVLGGLVAGPLLGWFVSTALSWRWAYLLTIPMIVAALIATATGGVVALIRRSR